MTTTPETEDEIIATLSDYVEGTLPAARKTEVEAKLATDETWKRIHGELRETTKSDEISGLLKARIEPAPFTTDDVTKTIHKRSAGRFFGRRTFGDRVPFSALLVIAVLGLCVIGYILWSSQTGSLKMDKRRGETPGSSIEVVPKP
jgi:anti-sigma factor RsiW